MLQTKLGLSGDSSSNRPLKRQTVYFSAFVKQQSLRIVVTQRILHFDGDRQHKYVSGLVFV